MVDSQQPRTRQELYDLVRQKGRDRFTLDEMIRLGFWPPEGEIPDDPADEIRRIGEIRQELEQLRRERSRLQNEQATRKQLLKERLAESRRKRQETKERRERERRERAEAWRQRQQREILYLGAGVSSGLGNLESDAERLRSQELPVLATPLDLAEAIGIALGELRFLAFARQTATLSHYIRFKIPKKTGGDRLISAPMPRLKRVQHWILRQILDRLPLHDAAHGFRCDRSIISNATPHVGQDLVVNYDLKNFFPSISYRRVKGVFRAMGYSEAVATILGLLCTEPEIEEVELDSKTYYVATSDRHLPQGSPASPALSNLICRRLDRRLDRLSETLGFRYTRYADDLTFSASGENLQRLCTLLRRVEFVVNEEGLTINDQKTRVMRRSRQQEVTGIVVNQRPNVSNRELKRFRATLFQIERDGIEGKHWGHSGNVLAAIEGYANFVATVNPDKGRPLLERVKRIKERTRRH